MVEKTKEDLKTKLKSVVTKSFKGGQTQHILVNEYNASWYGKSNKANVYNKDQIFTMLDILIDNLFFQMGNRVYKQVIGIPMGVDPAPFMANLYLYYDESTYMEQLAKTNYGEAKKYNKIQCYIDDLFALNNDGRIELNKELIYHKDLQLNKENEDDSNVTFLDLQICIKDNTVCTTTYDKREDFSFEIVAYPDLSGNIPKRQAYGVCTSQLLRHAGNCTHLEDFAEKCATLIKKLQTNGFNHRTLMKTICITLDKNGWISRKYKCNKDGIIKHITMKL